MTYGALISFNNDEQSNIIKVWIKEFHIFNLIEIQLILHFNINPIITTL